MKLLTFSILIFVTISPKSNENIIEITDKQIWDYWVFDYSKMGNRPELVNLDLYEGVVQFKYTFLIDIDGIPKDFKFISAQPKKAEIEKDRVKKLTMSRRYKRMKDSNFHGATLVLANEKWWKPEQSKITF